MPAGLAQPAGPEPGPPKGGHAHSVPIFAMPTIYGYARVSTREQDTTLQLDALQRAGVDLEHITQEHRSGSGKRPKLWAMLGKLKRGDVVMVYKLDRFARSLQELLRIVAEIEAKGAAFRSLTEAIDTASPAGRMMLAMLGAFAQFERDMIRERSMAGQQAARDRGVKFGRSRSLDPERESQLVADWRTGAYTLEGLATRYGIHSSSVKRAVYRVTKPGHSSLN